MTGELITLHFKATHCIKQRQFHPGQQHPSPNFIRSGWHRGENTDAEIAKHTFASPSEFNSSSWLFLPVNSPHSGCGVGRLGIARVWELTSPQSELSSQPAFQVQVHRCLLQGALHRLSNLPHSHFPPNCWSLWSF